MNLSHLFRRPRPPWALWEDGEGQWGYEPPYFLHCILTHREDGIKPTLRSAGSTYISTGVRTGAGVRRKRFQVPVIEAKRTNPSIPPGQDGRPSGFC